MSVDTDLSFNWTGLTITPGTGTAISIPNTTSISIDRACNQAQFIPPGKEFATHLKQHSKTRGLTIQAAGLKKLASLLENVPCTIAAVLNDATNGTGTGAYQLSAVNAYLKQNQIGGRNNEYANGSFTFVCISPDGTTDPITLTAV